MREPPKIAYFFMKMFLKISRSPKKICQLLEKSGIKKDMKILDFGCGIGSYSVEAAKLVGKAGKVIAVDQNDMMLKEIGREKDRGALSNIEIVKADSIDHVKESNFDYIFLIDMLHFMDDPGAVIDRGFRKLKAGGKLLIKFDHFKGKEIDKLLGNCGCSNKKNIFGTCWLLSK
ncbi:MAG: class I SAM-dependent methyltransferase [Candidatus Aenigmarchaeota archaeon]|nr:class I SAM-dependent methyltransferase [Candidatus Aenigmarchaeota archaeon]